MPKVRYYEDVKIIKKPFKKRFLRFVGFFCIVVVFSLCIVVSDRFSNVLTVSNGFSNIIYGDNFIKRQEKKYHAVILGEYDDLEECKNVAISSTIRGASGYVWQGDKYWAIGSIYFSLEDANAVLKNLSDSEYKATIKEITIKKINIKLDNYENKVVRRIENALDYFDNLIKKVYEYSIDFDKGVINNLAVSTYLSDLRGDCKVLISEMQSYLATPNESLQKIQNSLIMTDQLLNEVILKTIDNAATGYTLKNTIAQIIRTQYDLHLNLN